ncbi:MAG: hypothetical protein KJ941_09830, partial [Bacteroidetes bacterium]|nr:hypothetical protein [Bacteroidota bacterium]
MKKAIKLCTALFAVLAFAGCKKDVKIPITFEFTGNSVIIDVPPTNGETTIDICDAFYINLDSLAKAYEVNLDDVESLNIQDVTFTMIDESIVEPQVTMSIIESFSGYLGEGTAKPLFLEQSVSENAGNTITVPALDVNVKELAQGSNNFKACFSGNLREPLDHPVKIEVKARYKF